MHGGRVHDVEWASFAGRIQTEQLKSVCRHEHSEEQLRAELIEAMPALIVRRRDEEEVAPDLHHPHRIFECDGYVEHMFERAAVPYQVVSFVHGSRNWQIQVVEDRGPLV